MKIHQAEAGIRRWLRRDHRGCATATFRLSTHHACAGNRGLIRFSNDNREKY
jgi:hypothetical protein